MGSDCAPEKRCSAFASSGQRNRRDHVARHGKLRGVYFLPPGFFLTGVSSSSGPASSQAKISSSEPVPSLSLAGGLGFLSAISDSSTRLWEVPGPDLTGAFPTSTLLS